MGSVHSGKFHPIKKTVKPKAKAGKRLQSTASWRDQIPCAVRTQSRREGRQESGRKRTP